MDIKKTLHILGLLLVTPYLFYFKLKNLKKRKIYLYTDSRGFDAGNPLRIFLWNSYLRLLIKDYYVDFRIHPEKHTLLLDFIEFYQTANFSKYDFIILHVGISDFSPRPLSNIARIFESKKRIPIVSDLLSRDKAHRESPSSIQYKGELTNTIYSVSYFENYIIPKIKNIKNLFWISSNSFVQGWEGTYTNGRPINIAETVFAFEEVMRTHLKNKVISLDWNDDEVKRYTVDNIHFSPDGFQEVYNLIVKKIDESHLQA